MNPRALVLAALSLAALITASCAPSHRAGPKLIEADGVNYTGCTGAIWMTNDGNTKDPITKTYDVLFDDANGTRHHLTMVHNLRVSDLPDDTPSCAQHK